MPQQSIPCPECGTLNRKDNNTCRVCDAPLQPGKTNNKPRISKKILRRTDFMAASRANQKATRRLVALLLLIAAVLGYLAGWSLQTGMGHMPPSADSIIFFSSWGVLAAFILLGLSLLWTWIAFKRGDRIVMKMTGAQLANRDSEPQLYNVVEEMALAAGLSTPAVYIIETDAMNAFATGMSPTTASVAVTRGLLNRLTRDELQAVIGHEMGHVVNWDIRYATAVSILVGLIVLISDGILRGSLYGGGGRSRAGHKGDSGAGAIVFIVMLVFAILAPLIARLVQMAVSRQREFLADATSVRLTRNTHSMISALEKLSQETVLFDRANRATQHLFIVNPLQNFSERASALMATHPPITRRIQRLYNLGNKEY
jgi:heat shock protein HtpX